MGEAPGGGAWGRPLGEAPGASPQRICCVVCVVVPRQMTQHRKYEIASASNPSVAFCEGSPGVPGGAPLGEAPGGNPWGKPLGEAPGGSPWGRPLGEAPGDQIQALLRPDNVLCVCNIHKYPAFSV